MAAYTESHMVAQAVTIDDEQKFQLDVDITDKGDLSDENIFVVEIQDVTDPKEDEFARVVTVDDLEALTKDRTTAVANNDSFYRVKSWTFLYDNIDTAVNAKDTLKSRIDELVDDWRAYQLRFETTSETTQHPRVDTDTFNTAVETYELTLGSEQVAQETAETAKEEYDTAVADAATAATAVTDAEFDRDECSTTRAWFQALYDAMQAAGGFYQHAETFKTAAENFRVVCTGDHPTEEGTFVTAYNTFAGHQGVAATALSTASTHLSTFSGLCSDRETAYTNAQTAKATADTLVATKRTAYEDARSAYASAQGASEAALAAVRALKPDYDPTTATPNTDAATGG